MKSICYVVLPDNLLLDENTVYSFVRNHIKKYYSELEVESYKRFFSDKETLEIAKRQGFNNLFEFEEYLKDHKNEDGIENGLYYWITTYNLQGRWDAFILDDIKKGYDLKNEVLPSSVVTPDGIWHSDMDYGIKPLLDFEYGKQHPDNIEPAKKWRDYMDSFFRKNSNKNFAILHVKS